MSPPRFNYRKLTADEFKTELRQLDMSLEAFARIFGIPLNKAREMTTGKRPIQNWIPIALALLRVPSALGAARFVASEMIEDDRFHPEYGKFPYRGKESLPDDFETGGDN